jgi:hypothetical protein
MAGKCAVHYRLAWRCANGQSCSLQDVGSAAYKTWGGISAFFEWDVQSTRHQGVLQALHANTQGLHANTQGLHANTQAIRANTRVSERLNFT